MKRFVIGAMLAVLLFAVLLTFTNVSAAPALATFGNVVSTTVVRVGTFLQPVKQSNVTVTDGSVIVPTGSYQPLTSAANTGTAAIATPTSSVNNAVYLVNVGANTITLTDTGTLKLAGNAALGVTDGILLVFDGTNWVEITRANN